MALIVGTSGWQYRHWRDGLYAGVPQRGWLERYAAAFATVEINAAFYRLPTREAFERWRERTPDDFVMAVKMSRYLTHVRRLRDPREPVGRLLAAAGGLGDRLGPVLLQLPPTLRADGALLSNALAAFPPQVRVAVEPRHDSWWSDEIREVLTAHAAALCWADRCGRPVTPLWRTAGWGYVRFHEGAARPWPRYGTGALRAWADRLGEWPVGAEVFAYFNNDPGGAAVGDAVRLAGLVAATGRPVTRVPGGEVSAVPGGGVSGMPVAEAAGSGGLGPGAREGRRRPRAPGDDGDAST